MIALIAFVFTSSDETDIYIFILSLITIATLGIIVSVLQVKILKLIKETGEL